MSRGGLFRDAIRPVVLIFLLLPAVVAKAAPSGDAPAGSGGVGEAYRLYDAGRLEEAEAAFKALIARDPDSLDAREGLTWTYLRQGKAEEAAQAADARLDLAPADTRWRQQWIEIIHQVPSRRDEAISEAREFAGQAPEDLERQILVARILSWTPGRESEAAEEYRRAVEIDSESREARLGLARSLSLSGQLEEAKAIFDALIADDSRDAGALYGRSEIARWAGDYETANDLLRRAADADPENAKIRAALDAVEAQAAQLAAARRGISLPIVVTLVVFCVLLGTTSRRISPRVYTALVACAILLVGLGLLWLYRFPYR